MSIDYQFDDKPGPGTRRPVVPGIDWVCMPLPFALNHVNCWWLHDGEDTCLIDTGVASEQSRSLWLSALGEQEVPEQLLVTHFHPDHIGSAGWFAGRGSHLLGNETEVAMAQRNRQFDAATYSSYYADWYTSHGLGGAALSRVKSFGNAYASIVDELPGRWRWLAAGAKVELGGREFDVLLGRGHAPAMIMLYCKAEHLLIAADQVLPGISPNVSLMPGAADDNPLASYLADLETLRTLPVDTLVLPSHGRPFRGLHSRLDELAQHHAQRCEDLLQACVTPNTAIELFPVLFNRELDAQQTSFALGETLAHLRYLERQGRIRQVDGAEPCRFVALSI